MNKTKKILLIISTIFLFIGIAYNIFYIVSYFQTPVIDRPAIYYLIYEFINLGFMIAVAVMMIYILWGNGKYFRERYRYFVTSLIISICINLFSVSTILMIVSIYFNDSVVFYQTKDKSKDKNVVDITDESQMTEKEKKIQELRKMKDEGKITEEKFQEEIMKLL